jgi:hypothetical protein
MWTPTVSPLCAFLTKWTVTICSRPSAARHTPLQSEVNDPSVLCVLGPKIEVDQQSPISTRAGTPECCAHKPCPAQTIIKRGSSPKARTPRRPPRLRRPATVRPVDGSRGGQSAWGGGANASCEDCWGAPVARPLISCSTRSRNASTSSSLYPRFPAVGFEKAMRRSGSSSTSK